MMGTTIVLKRVFVVVEKMKGHIQGSNQRPGFLKQLTCSRDSSIILSLSPPSFSIALSTKEHSFGFCCVNLESIY